ncbi:DUF3159 domain-containing protein [Nocardia sp. NPDC048505]|uniref:DUF3159 domain-containing protein n=1 Tax=unclassified Nocardia TaxID=2637762 RepID=UPI0033ECC679
MPPNLFSSDSREATMTTSEARPSTNQQLLDQLGGTAGMIYSALPVLAFVVANALVALPIAIGAALVVAVALTVWRRRRGEPFSTAIGGVVGVVAAGAVALWTGSAGGYFLIGIWVSLAVALVLLVSLAVRRPLTGVVWNALHGGHYAWRGNRSSLTRHDLATLTLTILFGARFLVQRWLYENEATGWLAFAKIAMGMPLLAVALVVVVWAFRRSTEQFVPAPADRDDSPAVRNQ